MKILYAYMMFLVMLPFAIALDTDADGVQDYEDMCNEPTENSVLFPENSGRAVFGDQVYIGTFSDYVGCDCYEQLAQRLREVMGIPDLENPAEEECLIFRCDIDFYPNPTSQSLQLQMREFSENMLVCPQDGCVGENYFLYERQIRIPCEGFDPQPNPEDCVKEIIENDPRCVNQLDLDDANNDNQIPEDPLLEESEDDRVDSLLFSEKEPVEDLQIPILGFDPKTGQAKVITQEGLDRVQELLGVHTPENLKEGAQLVTDHALVNKSILETNNTTRVTVEIASLDGFVLYDVSVYESIPKEFAFDVSELSFSSVPVVLDSDPLIMWHFDEVSDRVDLSYSVNRSINISGTTVVTAGEVMERKSYWNIIIPIAVVVLIVLIFLFKPSKRL